MRASAAVAGVALMAVLAAACGASASAGRGRTTTTAAPTTTTSSSTTTLPPTTTTTGPPTWPAVIVQAMAQFDPVPAGARAPIRLPAVPGYITAETGGLGGQDNVTLVATSSPVPVDSPTLQSSGGGRELASFSTTPTASTGNAASQLASGRSQSIAACSGPSSPMTLPGGTAATTCATFEGPAINWSVGQWAVQVVTLDGSAPSTTEASHVAGLLTAASLPASDAGGILSVVAPGNASAGSADTAALEWTVGTDVYQVRSNDDPDSAVTVAAAMRPYPS